MVTTTGQGRYNTTVNNLYGIHINNDTSMQTLEYEFTGTCHMLIVYTNEIPLREPLTTEIDITIQ